MDSSTKSNCIALVIVIIAVIIVVAIVWCARYCGGNTNNNCGWSGSSGDGDCTDDDDDCDSPRPATRCPPKNSSCNWWPWVAVVVGVILVVIICVVIWRCFFCKKKKPETLDTTYVVSEEPCDTQKTNVTFVHDPLPPRRDPVAVAGVCDDKGECTYVTTSTNVQQPGSVLTSIPKQRTDLERMFAGQLKA